MSYSYTFLICLLTVLFFHSIAKSDNFKHGYEFQDCAECPKMIVVRGDTFTMGAAKSEKGSLLFERPRYEVSVRKFAVGQYEITWEQFHNFIQETGYDFGNSCLNFSNFTLDETFGLNYLNPGFPQEANHPVVCVSWYASKAYVKWLSKKTGKTYRLLTEAEWEYAASAKLSTAFWWGNSISAQQANYNGEYPYNGGKIFSPDRVKNGINRKKTVAVDSFMPNPFGLYNVLGNAAEWVEDCWYKNYIDAPTDGSARLSEGAESCKRRVVRGGAWYHRPFQLRLRHRAWAKGNLNHYLVGFRVARDLK